MSIRDLYLEVAPWATGLGIPATIGLFIRRLVLKTRAERRKDNAEADVEVGTVADRLKTSSVTAVEAQMIAMTKAWDAERSALVGTVDHQARQLTDERAYSASRDELIAELRAELEHVRRQLDELTRKIDVL